MILPRVISFLFQKRMNKKDRRTNFWYKKDVIYTKRRIENCKAGDMVYVGRFGYEITKVQGHYFDDGSILLDVDMKKTWEQKPL